MTREQAIANLIRLSKHYALSDNWQKFCKDVAELIAEDEREIRFLKAMSKEMANNYYNYSDEEIGQMVKRNF